MEEVKEAENLRYAMVMAGVMMMIKVQRNFPKTKGATASTHARTYSCASCEPNPYCTARVVAAGRFLLNLQVRPLAFL